MDRPAPPPPDLLASPEAGPAAVRGGALRLVGYATSVGLSVVSAALLFRHLGVVDGGRYVTALTIVGIFGSLADTGLTSIGIREFSVRPAGERRAMMRDFLGLRIVATTAGMVGATCFALAVGYPSELVLGIAAAGLGLLAQHLQTTLSVPLVADLRFGWVTSLDLVRQAISVVLIVLLVAGGASLLAFLAVPIPAGVAVLALTAWVLRGKFSLNPDLRSRAWLPVLRGLLPFAAATALATVHFRIPIVLVSLFASDRQTGYFGASFRVVDVLYVVPQLLFGAAFPIVARAARDDEARLRYSVGRMFDVAVIMGALLALVLALGAPFVIDVVAGGRFDPAAPVLRIHAFALGVAFIAPVFIFALIGIGEYRDILLVNLSALVIGSSATAILASAEGARGAAVGAIGTEVVLAVSAGWVLLRRRPGLRLSPRVAWRVAIAAALGACAALVPDLSPAVSAAVGGAVFVAVLAMLRGFPADFLDVARYPRARDSSARR